MIFNIKKRLIISSNIILLALTLTVVFFSSINRLEKYEIKYKFFNKDFSQLDRYMNSFFSYQISSFYFKTTDQKRYLDLNIEKPTESVDAKDQFTFLIAEKMLKDLRKLKDVANIDIKGSGIKKEFLITFHNDNKKDDNYYLDLLVKIANQKFKGQMYFFKNALENNDQLIKSLPDTIDVSVLISLNEMLKSNYSAMVNFNNPGREIISIQQIGNYEKKFLTKYISNIEFLSLIISAIFAIILINFKRISSTIFSQK